MPPLPEHQLAPIKEALFTGQKITAIKLYRGATNVGLAEAKDAVEKLEAELRTTSPEKFTAPPSGKGCVGVIVMCSVIVSAAAIYWFVVN